MKCDGGGGCNGGGGGWGGGGTKNNEDTGGNGGGERLLLLTLSNGSFLSFRFSSLFLSLWSRSGGPGAFVIT